jgi:hypothetical protein
MNVAWHGNRHRTDAQPWVAAVEQCFDSQMRRMAAFENLQLGSVTMNIWRTPSGWPGDVTQYLS